MNEFTKEELILIACWSANRVEQVGNEQAEDEGTFSLSHKIQDMIISYCDHEWRFYVGPYGNIARCSHCNKGIIE